MHEVMIVAYYAVAIGYCAYAAQRKSGDTAAIVLLSLLMPFVGIVIALLVERLRNMGTPSDDVERFKQLVEQGHHFGDRMYRTVDIGKETNIVPMEEALVVNDHTTRRRLLLDILKGDVDVYAPLLEQAVNNEDTETSHYAVSAVMEIKRKLQTDLQIAVMQYERHPEELEHAARYAGALKRLIDGGFMDVRTKRGYLSSYTAVLEKLIEAGYHDDQLFHSKIECEMELGRFDRAVRDCELFIKHYPLKEQAYTSALRVYFDLKRRDSFYQVLADLKASPIRISNETLTVVRYWSRS